MIDKVRSLWRDAVKLLGEEPVVSAVAALLDRLIHKAERGKDEEYTSAQKCELVIANLNLRLRETCMPGMYRPTTGATKSLIGARLADGFTLADFYLVNEHMVRQWAAKEDFRRYLRPATLYAASKFEGYLQEAHAARHAAEARQQQRQTRAVPNQAADPPAEPISEEFYAAMQDKIRRMKDKTQMSTPREQRRREAFQKIIRNTFEKED